MSYKTVYNILFKNNIFSPFVQKKTIRKIKQIEKEKKKQQNLLKDENQTNIEKADLVFVYDKDSAHPRHARSTCFGEEIQMDASVLIWFSDIKTYLHLAVDDSTETVVGAYFDYEETLNGYYHVFKQILMKYGVPAKFKTDNRTVFNYLKGNDHSIEKDTQTQFAHACKTMGVELVTASVSQAKGTIERLNESFQRRLPYELNLKKVKTIEEANEFLQEFVIDYNKKHSILTKNFPSVFVNAGTEEEIDNILSIISFRKVDSGSAIKYHNKYYLFYDENDVLIPVGKGVEATVIENFKNVLLASIGSKFYQLKEVDENKLKSSFDIKRTIKEESKKVCKYIPGENSPWRRFFINRYCNSSTFLPNISKKHLTN